jgi:hypothetical protein
MESISDAQLANGQLRWYSFGRYNVVALLISTQNNQYFDWCQLWDVSCVDLGPWDRSPKKATCSARPKAMPSFSIK